MLGAIGPMLDSGIINEETRQAISEAWDAQLTEAREEIRNELREEFANRYEHDKSVMVSALDKMVTESLNSEIAEMRAEMQTAMVERIEYKREMKKSISETVSKLTEFMTVQLAKEIGDFRSERSVSKETVERFVANQLSEEVKTFRSERKKYNEGVARLEGFVMKQLSEEINTFAKDKKNLLETKVNLIATAKQKMNEMQKNFIKQSSVLVQEAVTKSLKTEITDLKEDIQAARENMFGRRLFEAFASEFSVTHLNENKEMAKLQSLVKAKNRQLEESKRIVDTTAKLFETKERELKVLKESVDRKAVLGELLRPLGKEKASIMSDLLESVQTNKLRTVYEKYLPAVLNQGNQKSAPAQKAVLTETTKYSEATGDKAATGAKNANLDNIVAMKRLAGLT